MFIFVTSEFETRLHTPFMMKLIIFRLVISILFIFKISTANENAVTCGSVIKLLHKDTGHHLHSHTIAWGSGSGQQSVTATGSQNDPNSMWIVKESSNSQMTCDVSTPVKCGSSIRLEHASTGKNLHSHLFRAPLSGNQEVSGYGDNGQGDTGDNWVLECLDSYEKLWIRGSSVQFKHVDTGKYLYTSDTAKFTQQNCGQGCPIMGQTEISASPRKDTKTRWSTGQGVYFPPPKSNSKDEL